MGYELGYTFYIYVRVCMAYFQKAEDLFASNPFFFGRQWLLVWPISVIVLEHISENITAPYVHLNVFRPVH